MQKVKRIKSDIFVNTLLVLTYLTVTSPCLGLQIQGTEPNPLLTAQLVEQIQTMYNEATPEFVVDQNLYYPTATNYGYYCTGKLVPFLY